MYFDQFGNAKACCQQSQDLPLGSVAQGGILRTWNGERARNLRAAMEHEALDDACGFCKWQRNHAPAEAIFARTFDHLEPGAQEYPSQLEFAVSSVCNLQCVMCDGDFSSSIRVHREGRPPHPEVYQDAFFGELAEIMPQVQIVRMYGGEPFLARPSLRVLDIVADTNPSASVSITTNATVWNVRVERILNHLRPSVVVSLDGATAETYERVRQGASFDSVLENIDHYEQAGAQVSIAFCLMTENAHEFADVLAFAGDRRFSVGVNTVLKPERFSLYDLPETELRQVIDRMKQQHRLGRQAPLFGLWQQRVDELEAFLDHDESQVSIRRSRPWDAVPFRDDDWLFEQPPGSALPNQTVEVLFRDKKSVAVTGSGVEVLGATNEALIGLDATGLALALSVTESRLVETSPRGIYHLHRSDGLPSLQAVEHSDRWWVSRL